MPCHKHPFCTCANCVCVCVCQKKRVNLCSIAIVIFHQCTHPSDNGWVILITKACAIWQFPINGNVHSTHTHSQKHHGHVCVRVCFSVCNNKQWITTICHSACSLLLMFLDLWKCLVVSSKSQAIQPDIQVPLITFSFTERDIQCRSRTVQLQ